jgi:FMN phosphatase YigB (HAD superfamily)
MSQFKALFFDLDGTLLDLDMRAFLGQYLQLAARRLASLIPPEQFIPHLLKATSIMVENDGQATNETVFWDVFTPLVERERAELEPVFEAFYAEDFPQLRALARPKRGARAVVESALAAGYAVLITTNPLFPATAIIQRLEWAGLDDLPFRRVTTHENSRYCKPNLRFFDALAKELGCSAGECLVVGDEDMDMVAALAGYPTFLTPSATTNLSPTTPNPTYCGDLADVAALLQTGNASRH